MFGPAVTAGVIDENPPDRVGGDGEEMGSVLRLGLFLVHEFQTRLVHQRRSLKRVIDSLLLHRLLGECPQPVVDKRQKLIHRPAVAFVGINEKLSDVSITDQWFRTPDSEKKTAACVP